MFEDQLVQKPRIEHLKRAGSFAFVLSVVLAAMIFFIIWPNGNQGVKANPGTCYINATTTIDQAYVDTNTCDIINIGGNRITVSWSGMVDLIGAGSVHVTGTNIVFDQRLQLGSTDDFYVDSGASLTHGLASSTGLQIFANNITLTGTIDVNGKGCQGGAATADGYGPSTSTGVCAVTLGGYGKYPGGGGAHGGNGGRNNLTASTVQTYTYDNALVPTFLGSGGGGGQSNHTGGYGGGYVWLNATSTFTANGNVTANGEDGQGAFSNWTSGGGGSGGSVFVAAGTLTGSGTITANGGTGGTDSGGSGQGGGGGGGRISVYADSLSGFTLSNLTASKGSSGGGLAANGVAGSSMSLDRKTDDGAGSLTIISGFDFPIGGDFVRDNITINNGAILACPTTTTLTVSSTNSFIDKGSIWNCANQITNVYFGAATLSTTSTNWTFSNADNLTIIANAWTNVTTTLAFTKSGEKSNVNVANDLTFRNFVFTGGDASSTSAQGSWLSIPNAISLTLVSSTLATSVSSTQLTSLNIDVTSTIDATGKGCPSGPINGNGFGPSTTTGICAQTTSGYGKTPGGGAAHGGNGGRNESSATTGQTTTYDNSLTPSLFGSGGGGGQGNHLGGTGGGLIRLNVSGTLTLNGSLKANGGSDTTSFSNNPAGGGGSGGSVYVAAGTLTGGGVLTANGGTGGTDSNGQGGGGGGGRIAVYADSLSGFTLSNITVSKGNKGGGSAAADGTVGTSMSLDRKTDDGAGSLTIISGFDFPVGGDFVRDNITINNGAILTCPTTTTLTVSSTNSFIDKGSTWNCSGQITDVYLGAATLSTTSTNWTFSNATTVNILVNAWTNATTSLAVTKTDSQAVWKATNDLILNSFTYTGGSPGITALGGLLNIFNGGTLTLTSSTLASSVSSTAINLSLDNKSSINANGKGCQGGISANNGYGPNLLTGICTITTSGYGKAYSGGAAYGGTGGRGGYQDTPQPNVYGTSTLPTFFGSGGGGGAYASELGGAGGGLINLNISNTATINGTLSVNGITGLYAGNIPGGGGSGGSILFKAGTLNGTGSLSSNGGNGGYINTSNGGGGGGGGRIAVFYSTLGSFNLSNILTTKGLRGTTMDPARDGTNGTTWTLNRLTDDGAGDLYISSGFDFPIGGDFIRNSITIDSGAYLTCPTTTTLTVSTTNSFIDKGSTWACTNQIETVTLGAATLSTTSTNWSFTNTNALNINANTWTNVTTTLSVTKVGASSTWSVGSDLTLRGLVYTGAIAGTASANGGLLSIPSSIALSLVSSTLWSNVSSTLLTGLAVDALSIIKADEKGCQAGMSSGNDGYGPNVTTGVCTITTSGYGRGYGGGAAHGGIGGRGGYDNKPQVTTYDATTTPSLYGAGGGGGSSPGEQGGWGGGRIRIKILGDATVDGMIRANAGNGLGTNNIGGGGGAGGTVYLTVNGTLSGSGTVKAAGGNGGPTGTVNGGGGGGGGRVSVDYILLDGFDLSNTSVTAPRGLKATGSTGVDGGDGSATSTQTDYAPDAPTYLGPAGAVSGGTTSTMNPYLVFNLSDPDVADQVKYRIQIADSPGFTSLIVDYTSDLGAQGSSTFQVGQVAGSGSYAVGNAGQTLDEGQYYWRVKAIDPYNIGSAYTTANGGAVAFEVTGSGTYTLTQLKIKLSDARSTSTTSALIEFKTATRLTTSTQPCTLDPCGAIEVVFPRDASGNPRFTLPSSFTIASSADPATGDIWLTGLASGMSLAGSLVTTTNEYATSTAKDMLRVMFNMNGQALRSRSWLDLYIYNNKITNPNRVSSEDGVYDPFGILVRTAVSTTAINYNYVPVDSGTTYSATGNPTTVEADVPVALAFTVSGIADSVEVNGESTTASSTASACPLDYGPGTRLVPNSPVICAQRLTLVTSAPNGYDVYVIGDHNMQTAGGADIDQFKDGIPVHCASTSTCIGFATAWTAPTANVSDERTFGHLGYNTTDPSVFDSGAVYAAISLKTEGLAAWYSPVMTNPVAPPTGTTSTDIKLKVEISNLQEAGHYTAQIYYVVAPKY